MQSYFLAKGKHQMPLSTQDEFKGKSQSAYCNYRDESYS